MRPSSHPAWASARLKLRASTARARRSRAPGAWTGARRTVRKSSSLLEGAQLLVGVVAGAVVDSHPARRGRLLCGHRARDARDVRALVAHGRDDQHRVAVSMRKQRPRRPDLWPASTRKQPPRASFLHDGSRGHRRLGQRRPLAGGLPVERLRARRRGGNGGVRGGQRLHRRHARAGALALSAGARDRLAQPRLRVRQQPRAGAHAMRATRCCSTPTPRSSMARSRRCIDALDAQPRRGRGGGAPGRSATARCCPRSAAFPMRAARSARRSAPSAGRYVQHGRASACSTPRAYEREGDCDWVVGSFLLARREALLGAGLLDERFFLYCEEPDLCLRVMRAGWRVRHLPQLTIRHHAGKGGVRPRMRRAGDLRAAPVRAQALRACCTARSIWARWGCATRCAPRCP